jgi:endonuclease-3
MDREKIKQIVERLRTATKSFTLPLVDIVIIEYGRDPYLILISCLLSLRARDATTIHVVRSLFNVARTPQEILALPRHELERIIFKTGYYKNKAKVLRDVSQALIDCFGGDVPLTREELLSIKGIGPKTASLVIGLAFGGKAVCVDVHVHRISNRLGLVHTKTPEETEAALERVLPHEYWVEWNKLLVMWGQNVCTPQSPKCSQCAINDLCKKVGVIRSR